MTWPRANAGSARPLAKLVGVRSAAVLAVAIAAAGCSPAEMPNDPGIICTAIAVSALNVTVRDATSGAAVCDASVIALEAGGASYALRQTGDCRYAGAEERSGGFEVVVTRSGYRAVRV